VFQRGSANGLIGVETACHRRIGAGWIAEVTGDADCRFPDKRIGIINHRDDPLGHFGVTDRIERADRALPHGDVRVAEAVEQRLERSSITESSQRTGDGNPERAFTVIVKQLDERFRRARVAHPPEGDHRRTFRIDVIGCELLH